MTIIKQMKYGMLALLEYFDDIYIGIYIIFLSFVLTAK